MELNDIKELLRLVDESSIVSFELEQGGVKLRLRKAVAAPVGEVAPAAIAATRAAAAASAGAAGPVTTALASATEAAADEPGLSVVKSPIVGTFYRSPDPNAQPFVNVGDRVRVGQVICIIEAMKLMNEIESDVAGEVVKIFHENGHPVQFGDPLFSIRL